MGTNLNARKSTSPKHGSRYHRGKLDPLVLLLRAEPLLRHNPSSFPSSFSHNAWSKKARSGQDNSRLGAMQVVQVCTAGQAERQQQVGLAVLRYIFHRELLKIDARLQ